MIYYRVINQSSLCARNIVIDTVLHWISIRILFDKMDHRIKTTTYSSTAVKCNFNFSPVKMVIHPHYTLDKEVVTVPQN